MKHFFPIVLIFLLLGGCSKPSSSEAAAEETVLSSLDVETSATLDNEATTTNITSGGTESSITVETSSELPSSIELEDAAVKGIEPSDLFKYVYLPYAKREKPFLFNAVKTFAESSTYEVEINDPTDEELGTIKFIDVNGDYVYFGFNLVNGMETIVSISYYQDSSNSEVVLSNYSSDGLPQYDDFTTHIIGESSIKVNGPDEQQNFLFN